MSSVASMECLLALKLVAGGWKEALRDWWDSRKVCLTTPPIMNRLFGESPRLERAHASSKGNWVSTTWGWIVHVPLTRRGLAASSVIPWAQSGPGQERG